MPPIEESTCDKRVVGILTNLSHILNKLAAKPLTSPVITTPIAIKQSSLEKFLLSKILRIEFVVFWFLNGLKESFGFLDFVVFGSVEVWFLDF